MQSAEVQLLPAGSDSLARGLPPAPPGTLFVLGERGGIRVSPTARFTVIFGRDDPEAHVCVGGNDPQVSRRQGQLHCDGKQWLVSNLGTVPIRFPGTRLLLSGAQEPLPAAYTPLFIRTGPGREHVLEVRISGASVGASMAGHDRRPRAPASWQLSDRERLVLVVLGQRYLRHESRPAPLSWARAADQLRELQPESGWTAKRAEHIVGAIRARLSQRNVRGLTRDEVGEPIGNALNHNLFYELLRSTTLVPPDLRLLNQVSCTHSGHHEKSRR